MRAHPFSLILLALSFILLPLSGFAQEEAEFSKEELQKLWNSNVKAIIDLDQEKIIQQTNFPLEGDWFAAYELWDASEEELQEAYTNDPAVVFDQETRDILRQMTWEDIIVNDYEEGVVLSVPIYTTYEVDGEFYEFATFLEFASIDDQWMLIAIVYAG